MHHLLNENNSQSGSDDIYRQMPIGLNQRADGRVVFPPCFLFVGCFLFLIVLTACVRLCFESIKRAESSFFNLTNQGLVQKNDKSLYLRRLYRTQNKRLLLSFACNFDRGSKFEPSLSNLIDR